MKNNQSQKSKTLLQKNDKQQVRQLNKTGFKNYEKSDITVLKAVFLILPFIYGLFYEWCSCIVGIIFGIYLLVNKKDKISEKKEESGKIHWNFILMTVFVLLYLIVCFYAVDYGMAFLGFIKFLPLILFVMISLHLKYNERRELLYTIPWSASVMTILSICAYPTCLRKYFFKAGRLGGFFQYSNTFALYVLVGIIILLSDDSLDDFKSENDGLRDGKRNFVRHGRKNDSDMGKNNTNIIKKAILTVIMGVGIMITGSRSVFVFSIVILLVFLLVRLVEIRKVPGEKISTNEVSGKKGQTISRDFLLIIVGVIMIIAIGAVFAIISGNTYTVKRYLSITVNSSTFLGRLLYYKDALHMIGKHPMGLGYLGYRYLSTSEQTGVYYIRYVHNEWLQTGLDIGIIGMIISVVLVIKNLLSKNNSILQKVILAVITTHSLFDFDLQYLYIDLILILCMDWQEKPAAGQKDKAFNRKDTHKSYKNYKKIIGWSGCIIAMILFVYMGTGIILERFGKHKAAVSVYEYYTEAKVNEMLSLHDMDRQWKMAEEIIRQNEYCSDAYYVSAICAVNNKDYELMQKRQLRLIQLEKYNIEHYEQYIKMLSYALDYYVNVSDDEKVDEYAGYVVSIPDMIEDVLKHTSDLAYKIHDKPKLELDEAYVEYISAIEEYLKNIYESQQ